MTDMPIADDGALHLFLMLIMNLGVWFAASRTP
jgi:hypothetical protein